MKKYFNKMHVYIFSYGMKLDSNRKYPSPYWTEVKRKKNEITDFSTYSWPHPFIHGVFGHQVVDGDTLCLSNPVGPVLALDQHPRGPVHFRKHHQSGLSERQALERKYSF